MRTIADKLKVMGFTSEEVDAIKGVVFFDLCHSPTFLLKRKKGFKND